MPIRRVLIVDDELYIQRILTYKLRRAGLVAVAVGSAEEALHVLHSIPVHCLVVDAELPAGKSGFELAQILRDDSHLCRIPYLFLSTSHHPSGLKRARELGAYAFITKPFSLDRLMGEILLALPHYNEGEVI